MKTVILAGGMGTRLNEETDTKPKPMVEIGGKPILWHIMKLYSVYGIKEFIICLYTDKVPEYLSNGEGGRYRASNIMGSISLECYKFATQNI